MARLETYKIDEQCPPCHDFLLNGHCQSMEKRGRCHFHHPIDRIRFPRQVRKRVQKKRCKVCGLTKKKCKSWKAHAAVQQTNVEQHVEQHVETGNHVKHMRCALCTLELPCSHFKDAESMLLFQQKEATWRKRYPRPAKAKTECAYFKRTGTCPWHDTHGICCFYHGAQHANRRFPIDNTQREDFVHISREAHGFKGMPGYHRSSRGACSARSLQAAHELVLQDGVNLEKTRRRCTRVHNKQSKQWALPTPPLARQPLRVMQKSWKEKLITVQPDEEKRQAEMDLLRLKKFAPWKFW